ncbi:DUF4893 domain-containing protein [Sphingosinicella sp. YJ22]|uniref:DUF4893 domain-containing protein n=1 Tax=Sphingosinicella sp. YJ22 TaxID=1104780 RepID=UPI00140C141A|nr:DUF4893 domain-containing protein [Sphingosinicella sp. YJ22]
MTRPGSRLPPRLRRGLAAFAALALLAGCATGRGQANRAVVEQPEPGWRDILSPADQARLDGLDSSWTTALEEARRGGFTRRVANEGALLDPAGALPRAAPAPGSYRCRLIRIRPGSRRVRAFTSSVPYFCDVGAAAEMLSLTQQSGPERPGGYLWADGDGRMIFIGAAARGRESGPPAYGDSGERNVVGILERVGQFRYRLVMPAPANGATLEILELIPALTSR